MLTALRACAGRWTGSSILQDPDTGLPESSASTANITPIVNGRFVRIDYTWSYKEKPQDGLLLLGTDPQTGMATAYWVDSWHMGHQALTCVDAKPQASMFTLKGSFPAPSGPDWGWIIELVPNPEGQFTIRMFNVEPGGPRDLAVEANYTRAD